MKKILPVLIIGLMVAFSVKAADNLEVDELFRFKKNVITTSYCGGGCTQNPGQRKFFLNGKLLIDPPSNDLSLGLSTYNTNVSDVKVINFQEGQDYLDINNWYFINTNTLKVFKVTNHDFSVPCNRGHSFSVNGKIIDNRIDKNNCNKETVTNEILAKKTKVNFSGFVVDGKIVYKPQPFAPMECLFEHHLNFDDSEPIACADPVELRSAFLGMSRDLSVVYFSATGKGWTSYYAYDTKANKITKTTLTKINKDKIKLTLVKKF